MGRRTGFFAFIHDHHYDVEHDVDDNVIDHHLPADELHLYDSPELDLDQLHLDDISDIDVFDIDVIDLDDCSSVIHLQLFEHVDVFDRADDNVDVIDFFQHYLQYHDQLVELQHHPDHPAVVHHIDDLNDLNHRIRSHPAQLHEDGDLVDAPRGR